jgi:fructosamine-3-kinase
LNLPTPLRESLEGALGRIRAFEPVAGGCINSAGRLDLGSGRVFVKFGRGLPSDFFVIEAEGLRALAEAGSGLRIPTPIDQISDAEGWSWLALEWLEIDNGRSDQEALGAGLAAMHRPASGGWGWPAEGFIGTLDQANTEAKGWAEFWWDRRIRPQLELATAGSLIPAGAGWTALEQLLPEILAAGDREGPSLLHGDLWSGNVVWTDGGPALVDPACYRGHREVDLAMTELFGGFGRSFREAYIAARPLLPGYEARRPVYQLYYLLVHVNLFGASYVSPTLATLRQILTPA